MDSKQQDCNLAKGPKLLHNVHDIETCAISSFSHPEDMHIPKFFLKYTDDSAFMQFSIGVFFTRTMGYIMVDLFGI